jgi:hypothetical protein
LTVVFLKDKDDRNIKKRLIFLTLGDRKSLFRDWGAG